MHGLAELYRATRAESSVRARHIVVEGPESSCGRERIDHLCVAGRRPVPGADSVVVANKTDLCSSEPPTQPSISYGQAVYTDASVPSSSDTPSPSPTPNAGKKLLPRAVSANEGALFAKEHGLLYVETSAKEGWGVLSAFEWTAREALKRHNEEELARRKVSAGHGLTRFGTQLMHSLAESSWTKTSNGVAAAKPTNEQV